MMTDPVADLLTRIRNAVSVGKPDVVVPSSKTKIAVAEVLKREGYIEGFEIVEKPVQNDFRIKLKYGPEGERVITHIERISKPGRRVYRGVHDLKPVLRGLGISVVSTSKGVMSDREAREARVGGEVLCRVW
ncbi:MAG: 30S ribosomal protein S8 [Planctomycetota bacterium]|jgi:small subunit ribosomal protein S8